MRTHLLRFAVFITVLAGLALPAHASKDMVQFGSRIVVEPDQSIHDAVCFFCSVDDRGTVEGDIVVFFGNVNIDGKANQDVVNFFGNVNAADDASIGKDLVKFFGHVHLGDNVSVGKDIVVMFGALRVGNGVRNGGDRVVQPGFIFWAPLLIIFTVVILVVRE